MEKRSPGGPKVVQFNILTSENLLQSFANLNLLFATLYTNDNSLHWYIYVQQIIFNKKENTVSGASQSRPA